MALRIALERAGDNGEPYRVERGRLRV